MTWHPEENNLVAYCQSFESMSTFQNHSERNAVSTERIFSRSTARRDIDHLAFDTCIIEKVFPNAIDARYFVPQTPILIPLSVFGPERSSFQIVQFGFKPPWRSIITSPKSPTRQNDVHWLYKSGRKNCSTLRWPVCFLIPFERPVEFPSTGEERLSPTASPEQW